MSREVRIGPLEELKDGVARRVEDNGNVACVVRCGDVVYAIDDTCSHEDYSLSEGEVDVEECAIECWKHGSLFSLATGEPLTFPATRPVAVYPVTIDDGIVVVHLPDVALRAEGAAS
jgi:3-phenylpropionate/trans-cinnamate dioxygenase ferredoxin subunit